METVRKQKEHTINAIAQVGEEKTFHKNVRKSMHISSSLDKAPRLSISIVIWILSSDTETCATTPLEGGTKIVLAK